MRFSCLIIFLLYLLSLSYGKDENFRNKMADAIIRKLYNITVNVFSKGTPEEKEKAWNILQTKLKQVSEKKYGDGAGKYIDLIMRGIKSMTPPNSESPPLARPQVALMSLRNVEMVKKDTQHVTAKTQKVSHTINTQPTAHASTSNTSNIENKKALARKIADKLQTIAKDFYNKTSDKKHIYNNIKNKIKELIIRKHTDATQYHNDLRALSERLASEIETVVGKVLANFSKQVEEEIKNVTPPALVLRNAKHLVITTPPPVNDDFRGVTSTVNCDSLTDKVCSALKNANKIICPLDGTKISVDRLCDGVNDCLDRYDERDCVRQAIDKIRDTRRLISNVEETVIKNCASTHIDNSILSKQSSILGSVLQSELDFLRLHTESKEEEKNINEEIVKKTVNEVALVLSSLSIGLEGSLCPRYYGQDEADEIIYQKNSFLLSTIDKNDPFEDIKQLPPQSKSSVPNKCMCAGSFCSDINCSHLCRLICWQKHSLGSWGCSAIDGGTTVPLAYLCDGKTDCYDRTDEEDCAIGDISRFEAVGIYDNILTDLSMKAQANEMQYIRNNLLSLRASVSYLQKVTTQAKPQPDHVRTVRDLCFSSLVSTYDKVLSKGIVQNIDDIHKYLLSINQKLVSALKRSHAGNDKIVTLEGCYCQKDRCAMMRCSKKCERACAVESQFTMFSCDGTPNSPIFVHSGAICNGKANCPNGEDEANCKKESCRAHHFVLLRHSLSKVGEKDKGTALGDILMTWRAKVSTTLVVAESNGRPTMPMLREVIDSINRDVVASYASMGTKNDMPNPLVRVKQEASVISSKLDAKAYKEFFDLSQLVLRTLKSCQ